MNPCKKHFMIIFANVKDLCGLSNANKIII